MKNVVNVDQLTFEHGSHGDKFEWRSAQVSQSLGARELGYALDVIPPTLPASSSRQRSLSATLRRPTGKRAAGRRRVAS